MSASWSLTGGKRTSSGQPNLVEIDPKRTSLPRETGTASGQSCHQWWSSQGQGFKLCPARLPSVAPSLCEICFQPRDVFQEAPAGQD